MNPFIYTLDNKRYHTLNYYNKSHFDKKVFKAIINTGCLCPNIDGTISKGGCIYCSNKSEYFSPSCEIPIKEQLDMEINRIHTKHEDAYVVAYFQSGTNTYGDFEKLKQNYETVLTNPFVKGISIGTRADCISDDMITYFKYLSSRTHLTIELGLQSTNDDTAKVINRGHDFECFKTTFIKLKQAGIRTCVHIINSLPFEDEATMLQTAKDVGSLYPDAVKIHMLHINKNTPIEKMYLDNKITLLSKEEYVDIVVKQLELLPPTTVVERLTGDADKNVLVAPNWTRNKLSVLVEIDKLQAKLDSYQGLKFNK